MRPAPKDFAEMREKLGSVINLAKHYRAAHETIRRWRKELDLPKIIHGIRPVPDDFTDIAPTMTKLDMIKHYKTSYPVLDRWIAETGVRAKVYIHQPKRFNIKVAKSKVPPPKRDTNYDLAAEYLRRFGPVHKCNADGKYSEKGKFYRVGINIMSPAEMVEKSQEKQRRDAKRYLAATSTRG